MATMATQRHRANNRGRRNVCVIQWASWTQMNVCKLYWERNVYLLYNQKYRYQKTCVCVYIYIYIYSLSISYIHHHILFCRVFPSLFISVCIIKVYNSSCLIIFFYWCTMGDLHLPCVLLASKCNIGHKWPVNRCNVMLLMQFAPANLVINCGRCNFQPMPSMRSQYHFFFYCGFKPKILNLNHQPKNPLNLFILQSFNQESLSVASLFGKHLILHILYMLFRLLSLSPLRFICSWLVK